MALNDVRKTTAALDDTRFTGRQTDDVPVWDAALGTSGRWYNATLATLLSKLAVFVGSGPGHAKGLVPDPGSTAGTTRFLREDATWAAPGGGSVTSVALSLPSILTVSGSPVTTSGTLTGTLATQTANYVWSGPTTGAAAAPTFRALVAADVPDLSGTYLPLTGGTVTGATTFSAGITATAATSGVAITAKAAATTPGNIQEWKTNGGTLLSYIDSGGQAYIKNNVYVGSELHIARSDQGGNPAAASAKVYYGTNNALIFVDHTGAKTAFSVSGIGGYDGGGDNFNFPGYGNINTSVNSFILGGSSPIAAGTRLSVIGRSDQPAYPTAIIQGVASQTAPLLALQQLSSTATARKVANVDGYFADNTDASYKGGGKLSAYYLAGSTETAQEALRWWTSGNGGRVALSAPNSAPTDSHIGTSQIVPYLDETGAFIKWRVRQSDGTTLKTGSLAIA